MLYTKQKKTLCSGWQLYAITCPEKINGRDLQTLAEEAILGGVDVLQLRDKQAGDDELIQAGILLKEVTKKYRVPLIVNDRIRVAKAVSADGLHLGQEDGVLDEAQRVLGERVIFGRSTHSPEQALRAQEEGFDYIGVGPVYATPTKAGRPAVGLEFIRYAHKFLTVPFVAIGGIDRSNAAGVRDAGARCIAVVRALLGADDPKSEAQALKKIMRKKE